MTRLLPLLFALLISGPAFAGGFVTSIADSGVEGWVWDSGIGSVAFYDDALPSKGIEVGDEVIYNLTCGRLGCQATDLILVAQPPDLVVTGRHNGDLTVHAGELVHIQGEITRDLVVDGGTVVLFPGAEVGRDLELLSGDVEVHGATVGRDLLGGDGALRMSSGHVGRTLGSLPVQFVGEFSARFESTSNGSAGVVTVGRDLEVVGHLSLGDGVVVQVDRHLDHVSSGGVVEFDGVLDVDNSLTLQSAGPLRVVGDGCIFGGDVQMRSDNGGLTINGEVHAEGNIDLLAAGPVTTGGVQVAQQELAIDGTEVHVGGTLEGGSVVFDADTTLTVVGDVSAGSDVRGRLGDGSIDINAGTSLSIDGSVTSISGDVDLDAGADVVVNGSVTAGDDVGVESGGRLSWSGDVGFGGGATATGGAGLALNLRTFPQHYCESDVVLQTQFTSRLVVPDDGAGAWYVEDLRAETAGDVVHSGSCGGDDGDDSADSEDDADTI